MPSPDKTRPAYKMPSPRDESAPHCRPDPSANRADAMARHVLRPSQWLRA